MTTYTVKKGDTLGALARKYGTTVSAIAKANNISNPNLIRVGQKLTISGSGSSSSKPKISDEALEYGFSGDFLRKNSSIRKLVDKAIDQTWTSAKFLDELRKTSWWKNRSDAQKQYEAMKVENPGELDSMISRSKTAITNMSVRLGVSLTSSQVSSIATSWVKNGLSEAEVRDMVGKKYSGPGGAYSRGNLGVAGAARAQLVEMARQYGFTIGTNRANEFARNVARGRRQVSDYESYFRQRAQDLFPAIAAQLKGGSTVRDVLEPYVQIASRELGISPTAMQTVHQKWLKPVSGEKLMSTDEWLREVRTKSTYGYDQSQNASREASIYAGQLMSALGRR